jgi:hypothetical protein
MDITKNGQTVKCEGEFSNQHPMFEFECYFDNDIYDCVFAAGEATSWEEAVEHITQFAINNQIILLEMTALEDNTTDTATDSV